LLLCDLSTDSIPWRHALGGKVGHNSSVVVSLGFHPSSSPNASFRSLVLKQFVEDDPKYIGVGRIVFLPCRCRQHIPLIIGNQLLTTWRHILESGNGHSHSCVNLEIFSV